MNWMITPVPSTRVEWMYLLFLISLFFSNMMLLSVTGSQGSLRSWLFWSIGGVSSIMSRKNSCFTFLLLLLVSELTTLNERSFSDKRLIPDSKFSSRVSILNHFLSPIFRRNSLRKEVYFSCLLVRNFKIWESYWNILP